MAVRFILGRSGTGKTTLCLRELLDHLEGGGDEPLLLLVPEQATHQMERALLTSGRVKGFARLRVMSFGRLALLTGEKFGRPLSAVGRGMLIHRIMLEEGSRLKVLGAGAGKAGLSEQLAEIVCEMIRQGNTAADLFAAAEQLREQQRGLTAMKLADIAVVLEQFEKHAGEEFLDSEMTLSKVLKALPAADFVKNCRLYVDGFSGFTGLELTVLAELLKASSEASIALCLDGRTLEKPAAEDDIFTPTRQTYERLTEIVKQCRLTLAEPVILSEGHRFTAAPLVHIEKNLFTGAEPVSCEGAVRIVPCSNIGAEAEMIARTIRSLVKQGDYRWRDIAVIASDLENCHHYIRACFADHDIPFFIDRRKSLSQLPPVKLITAALQMAVEGLNTADMLDYLKTDLTAVTADEISLLENYCAAFAIRSEDWIGEENWSFADNRGSTFDEKQIDHIRRVAAKDLIALRKDIRNACGDNNTLTAAEFITALTGFLNKVYLFGRLRDRTEQARQEADHITAQEYSQFCEKLGELFAEVQGVLADSPMRPAELARIIAGAFEQLSLAFVPPALDEVLVGSIERSRHPDIKVAFLMGVTQKQFPAAIGGHSLLNDSEREQLDRMQVPLGPSQAQSLIERQYLAYIAFTRPSERLYISYPLADEKHRPVIPSHFIEHLAELFTDLSPARPHPLQIETVDTETELADHLCRVLGADKYTDHDGQQLTRCRGVLERMRSEATLTGVAARVQQAISYRNKASLDPQIVEQLFAGPLITAVTKLGTFAACPYQYFARHSLKLGRRREFKLEPLDVGDFYHKTLDRFTRKLIADNTPIAGLGDEQLRMLLDGAVEGEIIASAFLQNFRRHSKHNAYTLNAAVDMLTECVFAWREMARAGSFVTVHSELEFGFDGHGLLLETSQGTDILIRGKVDRVDIARSDNGPVAIVFDYKKSPKKFGIDKAYFGLDMQLPVYMLAVRQHEQIETECAAGAFLMPVEVRPRTETISKIDPVKFHHKAHGLFTESICHLLDGSGAVGFNSFYNYFLNKDGEYGRRSSSGVLTACELDTLLKYTRTKLQQLGSAITVGCIAINPCKTTSYTACGNCDYRSLCKFDWQVNNYNYLDHLGKEEVLERMADDAG